MIRATYPLALAAVTNHPVLYRQVAAAVDAQARRIEERTADYIPRAETLATLDAKLRSAGEGLVLLEGPPGSGATSLLCYLAANRVYPCWLPEDDAGQGLEALCAQLIALHKLPVPIVPPIAGRDAATLERLLSEAAAGAAERPLVVLIDQLAENKHIPGAPPFPAAIPSGLIIVYACTTGSTPPLPPVRRMKLPSANANMAHLVQAATQHGCDDELARLIASRSGGSFLYVRIAAGLVRGHILEQKATPRGLTALYSTIWQRLDELERRFVCVLAAAGEPLAQGMCAALVGVAPTEIAQFVRRLRPLLEIRDGQITLYHASTHAFLTEQSGEQLAAFHTAYVELAHKRADAQFQTLNSRTDAYFMRQLARHLTLSRRDSDEHPPPELLTRAWVLAQERYTGDMRAAARDALWELAAARHGPLLRLFRAAALAGSLALLGRSLPAEGLAAAFDETLQRGEPRDVVVRRARALVDQLPDGRNKATVLRRLGEACYERRMRSQAMRMLSEALDLEIPGLPRIWHDEREETMVAFARAAIAGGAPDMALGITTHISHPERRGLIETDVVRWLLARGMLTRAEEVAYAIGHEHTHEWAMAEVAVGHARAGADARAEEVLSTLKTETSVAWARTELACATAARGDRTAMRQLDALPSRLLRDRALGQIAVAFAVPHPDLSLSAAQEIADPAVQAQSLINIAMLRQSNAVAALALATEAVQRVGDDDRTALTVALAIAYATIGDVHGAQRAADSLTESEERDRAKSRVAVALARQGDHATARTIAQAVLDDDERFWTLHELARLLAESGDWRGADALADQIADDELRARVEANLCVVLARAGSAALAQQRAALITVASERIRAYITIAEDVVRHGAVASGRAALRQVTLPDAQSRYQSALAAALAAHNDLEGAHALALTIARPLDRAKALIAIARRAAPIDRVQAMNALGQAFQTTAPLGRAETYMCLSIAAETLAALGGNDMLLAAANLLNEIDGWWG
jgi:hypothetical protein